MNVYTFELQKQAWSIAFQTVVLAGLLAGLMLAVYPVYVGAEEQVKAALSGFPPEFAAAFGLAVENIFSYGGFYAFGNLYLTLVGAIFAATLGLSVFAREKRSQCIDFLLTKPLGRGKTFNAKLLACLSGLIVMNAVFVAVSFAVHAWSGDTQVSSDRIALVSLGMAGTQVVFLALGVFFALFLRRVRSVSGIASMLGMAGFVLMALVNLTEEDALRFVSPLQYFDPTPVFSTGSYDVAYVATAAALTVVLLVVSFVHFCKSDIASR